MKTDVTTPGSYLQSKALARENSGKKLTSLPLAGKDKALGPDYKVDLSQTAKTSSSSLPSLPSLPSAPSVPSAPSTPSVSEPPKPDITSELKNELEGPVKKEVIEKAEEVAKPEPKAGTVKKPAIFFIKGLDVFSSPSKSEGGYAGVGRMAEAVKGARIYGWDQKDDIIKEIKKTHKDYPVILVGHSLGGDTAIDIANTLDSLKEDFRGIDLLITLDAIGFSHDIIPQNVKKHLNVFGETSLLKDGPHVARREEMTKVRNILSPLDHTDIDDDRSIQYEVITQIENTLNEKLPAGY